MEPTSTASEPGVQGSENFPVLPEDVLSQSPGECRPVRGLTKGPFGYFGAKQRLALQIVRLLPPHNAWVEAFCGSAAVTLAKQPAPIEIINDANSQIVNVFRQLRENGDGLCKLIDLTPYSREEFEQAQQVNETDSELEQARKFLVAAMMTVNGASGSNGNGAKHSGFSYSQSYARKGQEARVSRWNTLPERLRKVIDRLKQVRVERRDARDLLKMFLDRPATLVYLDPPYLMDRKHGYHIDANDRSFHEELLNLCCKAKCMVLISGYENPVYDSVLTPDRGWERTSIETHTRDTKGRDFSRTELLWKNQSFLKAVTRGRVPIRLSAKEKEYGKINPLRSSQRSQRQPTAGGGDIAFHVVATAPTRAKPRPATMVAHT